MSGTEAEADPLRSARAGSDSCKMPKWLPEGFLRSRWILPSKLVYQMCKQNEWLAAVFWRLRSNSLQFQSKHAMTLSLHQHFSTQTVLTFVFVFVSHFLLAPLAPLSKLHTRTSSVSKTAGTEFPLTPHPVLDFRLFFGLWFSCRLMLWLWTVYWPCFLRAALARLNFGLLWFRDCLLLTFSLSVCHIVGTLM